MSGAERQQAEKRARVGNWRIVCGPLPPRGRCTAPAPEVESGKRGKRRAAEDTSMEDGLRRLVHELERKLNASMKVQREQREWIDQLMAQEEANDNKWGSVAVRFGHACNICDIRPPLPALLNCCPNSCNGMFCVQCYSRVQGSSASPRCPICRMELPFPGGPSTNAQVLLQAALSNDESRSWSCVSLSLDMPCLEDVEGVSLNDALEHCKDGVACMDRMVQCPHRCEKASTGGSPVRFLHFIA